MQRSEIDAIPLEGDVSFRQRAVEPDRTALLLIDLQKGEYNPDKIAAEPQHAYLFERIRDVVIPNGQKLLAACRAAGVEVIYTVVESLTLDGRDRSLDYKISGHLLPEGRLGGRGAGRAEAAPQRDRHPQDLVQPLQLHQFRIRAAQSRRRVRHGHGHPDRSVRRDRGARRLRSRFLDDADRRRLRHRLRAAAQGSADRLQGLLPDPHDRPGDRGAAAPGGCQRGCLQTERSPWPPLQPLRRWDWWKVLGRACERTARCMRDLLHGLASVAVRRGGAGDRSDARS